MISKNVGSIDRTLRLILGIIALAYSIYYGIGSLISLIILILGIVLILTAVVSYCPIYTILKFDTIFQKEKQ